MTSIGEKIKDAFTGHHDHDHDEQHHKTSSASAATAAATTRPHDPEYDAQKATSEAGNYPYWRKGMSNDTTNKTPHGVAFSGLDAHESIRQGLGDKAYQQHEQLATTGTRGFDETTKSKDSRRDSGFATGAGAGAAGLGAAGLGYAAAKHHDNQKNENNPILSHNTSTPQRDVPDRGREPGQGSFAQPDLLPIRENKPFTSTASFTPKRNDNHDNLNKGLAAGALGAGTLGGAYVASKHKSDADRAENPAMSEVSSKPAQAGPGSLDKDYASQLHHSTASKETPDMTNIIGSSAGQGSSSDKPENRDWNMFGADTGRTFPLTQSSTKPYDTLGSSSYGDNSMTSSAPGATILDTGAGASGVYSQSSNSNKLVTPLGGSSSTSYDTAKPATDNSSSKHEKELFGAGAGAAGLVGTGYLLSSRGKDNKDLKDDTKQPSSLGGTTYATTSPGQKRYEMPHTADTTNTSAFGGSHMGPTSTSTSGGVHNTVIGAGSSEYQNTGIMGTSNLGSDKAVTVGPHTSEGTSTSALGSNGRGLGRSAPHDNHDREKQALAAAATVGAGAGVYGAERKHRRDEEEKQRGGLTGAGTYNTDSSGSQGLPSHPASTSTMPHSQPAHVAAQQAWRDNNQPSFDTSGTGNKHVGVEPGMAVYYGQGREHDQNPRSDESEKIAERALGSDGKPHAPQSQSHDTGRTGYDQMASGRKMFSMPGTYPSASKKSGLLGGNKVIHKCHQCGAENDISDYLKKDM